MHPLVLYFAKEGMSVATYEVAELFVKRYGKSPGVQNQDSSAMRSRDSLQLVRYRLADASTATFLFRGHVSNLAGFGVREVNAADAYQLPRGGTRDDMMGRVFELVPFGARGLIPGGAQMLPTEREVVSQLVGR